MGELNLLRPRPVTLLRQRRSILSCALLIVMLGIYGLWIERESVRAQLTDLQQLQAKQRLDQQQQQLQQAALQQRAGVVEQQRRIINVLRGVAMSKAASAHYTKCNGPRMVGLCTVKPATTRKLPASCRNLRRL